MLQRMFTLITVALLLFTGCGHEDDVVDCFGESLVTELKHEADGSVAHKVKYSIQYFGTQSVGSVSWDFGDGKKETTSSVGIDHTYAAAGTYTVKADVQIKKGGASCTVSPKKDVTVN